MNIQDPESIRTQLLPEGLGARAKAERVAKQFEQVLVQQIVKGMRKSATIGGEGELFGKGPGAQTYNDWFDMHLSRHVAGDGRVGVADLLLRDWERMGQIPGADETQEKIDVQA